MRKTCSLIIIATLCRITNAEIANGTYDWLDPKCLPKKHSIADSTIMCDDERIIIDNDSFFMNTSPVMLEKGRKFYSSSDGGFRYYAGTIKHGTPNDSATFSIVRCDYCIPARSIFDSSTGYNHPAPHNLTIALTQHRQNIAIANQIYRRTSKKTIRNHLDFTLDSTLLSRPVTRISRELIKQSIEDLLADQKAPTSSRILVLESPLPNSSASNVPKLRIPKECFADQNTNWNIAVIDTIPKASNLTLLRIVSIYEHPHRANINICSSPADSICTATERCYEQFYMKSDGKFKKIATSDTHKESELVDIILKTTSPPPVSEDCKEYTH